jgi:hypothetical protein
MSSAHVHWTSGGEAQIVSIAADGIVLRSTVPAPPGSRLEGTVNGEGTATSLRIKVHASRREGEGEFMLRGRPLDLTREVRERLAAMIGDAE